MYVHPCVCLMLGEARTEHRFLGTGQLWVTVWCWEPNLCPLQEQAVLLNLWGIFPAPKICASMKSFWDKGTHVNTWPLLRMSPVLDGMQNLIWVRRKSSKFVTETTHFCKWVCKDFGDLAFLLPPSSSSACLNFRVFLLVSSQFWYRSSHFTLLHTSKCTIVLSSLCLRILAPRWLATFLPAPAMYESAVSPEVELAFPLNITWISKPRTV